MRKGKALLGFMSWPEALSFYEGDCVMGTTTEAEIKAHWEKSTKAIDELPSFEERELELQDMPPECHEHLEVVSGTQLFKTAMAQRTWSFKLVPVDGLLAFQKYVDVTYAA